MATLTVTTNADSGTGSLRQAIADAASGDTIEFDSTVFPAGQTTAIPLASTLTVSKSLTIDAGTPGRYYVVIRDGAEVVVDENNPAQPGEIPLLRLTCRVALDGQNSVQVALTSTESTHITWHGVVFQNGKDTDYYGGGLLSDGGSVNTLTECVFSGNSANDGGGGLYAGGESVNTLTECVFSGNSAGVCGGGLFSDGGSVNTLTECVFSGNSASGGGGLYSVGYSENTLTECVFSGNSANGGGGLLSDGDSENTLTECVFSGNSAGVCGGGLYANSLSSSKTTLNLNDGNIIDDELYIEGYDATYTPTLNFSGYNGVGSYTQSGTAPNITGSGHVALPSNASVTLPATITRSEYGAGVSNFATNGDDLTWSSTDSTKSVLLEKQNGASWTTLSTSASSPYATTDNGTFRIWDGSTFLTVTKTGPQTLIVTNTNNSGAGSLRAALASARAVDTVTFDASLSGSTITLASGLTISNAVEIVGLVDGNGDPAITISGAGSYRILSGNYPMIISNLVFTNAGDHAIYNEDADGSSFVNCVFSNNSATDTQGGAVYIEGTLTETDAATFTNCVFSGNTSVFSTVEGTAGALFIQRLNVVLTDCDFTNNTAEGDEGGAIVYFGNATLTLDGCTFTGNSVSTKSASTGAFMGDVGGAIYSAGAVVATDCTFTGNSVNNPYDGDKGGAVYAAGSATFTDCSFSSNSASGNGGAIYSHSTTTLSDCTFSGNTATNGADFYGGELNVPSGIVTIPNVYIASGSIVSIANGAALSVSNSATITGSVGATNRGYLATPPGTDLTGATLTNIVACNYGAGVSAFSIDEDSADWTAVNSNISVLLEKKVNNAWQTLAQPTGTSYSTTFSDGDEARIFDGVQFRTASAVVPTTLVVTNTNPTGAGSLAQAVIDARAVDTITFDPSLSGSTITLNAGLGPRNEITIIGLTDNDGNPAIIVDGNGNYTFNSSYPVHVSNVAFDGGWGAFSSSGGFDGSTFENCTFENMDLNVFEISVKTTEYLAITESGATVSLIVSISDLSEWSVGDEFHFEGDIAYFEVSRVTTDTHGQGLIQASRRTVSDPEYLAPEEGIIIAGRPGAGIEFTDCIFSDNAASDLLLSGVVNVTLSGGNVLKEGFNLTNAATTVITNANYNGVGAYTAPSSGSVSVAGSGNIALPDAAVVTVAQTVTRSEFGAGLTAISANERTISWTATDSTKSVLLEVENGSDWDAVDDDATSPTTVSTEGLYRIWDGVVFLTIDVTKTRYWQVRAWADMTAGGGGIGDTSPAWIVTNKTTGPNLNGN